MANDLQGLPPESRIWIYGADRALTPAETTAARARLQEFVSGWVSHRKDLSAGADILHDRFVVLAVDESQAEASGCSIDGSVRFLQELGAELQIDFFNRMMFSYRDDKGHVQTVSRDTFKGMYGRDLITNETIVFDSLIKELGELRQIFERPLEDSWHSRMV